MRIRSYTTAGLALVGAAMIVATPVVPPPADLRVSASQFDDGADSTGRVLDPAFLDSMRSDPVPVLYPVSVVKQWVKNLLEDAKRISGEAGPTDDAVTGNEQPLTLDTFAPGQPLAAASSGQVRPVAASVGSDPAAVRLALENFGQNAAFVSDQMVAVAFASAAAVAGEPQLILGALAAAAQGDLSAALYRLTAAAAATLVPPIMVFNAARSAVNGHTPLPPVEDTPVDVAAPATQPDPAEPHAAQSRLESVLAGLAETNESPGTAAHQRGNGRSTATASGTEPSPVGAAECDMQSGNKVVPNVPASLHDTAEGESTSSAPEQTEPLPTTDAQSDTAAVAAESVTQPEADGQGTQ